MSSILEQVQPETAHELEAQAQAVGLSVDEYLKSLLGMNNEERQSASSIDEFMAAMNALAEDGVSPLPRNFSREDIYFPED